MHIKWLDLSCFEFNLENKKKLEKCPTKPKVAAIVKQDPPSLAAAAANQCPTARRHVKKPTGQRINKFVRKWLLL